MLRVRQTVSCLESQASSILGWLDVDILGISFGRETKIDEAFNAWREESTKSGESFLSTVLKKRYDDLVGDKKALIASRDKLISGGPG